MKLFLRYLKGRRSALLAFAVFALALGLSFMLYRLPVRAVLYPTGLCASAGFIALGLDYARVRRRHLLLKDLREPEAGLPEPVDIEAADYRAIAERILEARRALEDRTDAEARAMVDYYTLWVHQVKTPIAAMRLRLQGQDSAEARALLSELMRVEHYVEMVLTYLRLEGEGTDYVIRRVDLDALLRGVFKRFSGEFILRKLKLDYAPTGARVLTDEKWLAFVVEQVLSNALKYTPAGSISVYLEAPATLCVRDTGIGIAPEDLPRVFEQGYTGLVGREDRRASGIGLYLCKRVCDSLGHGIAIQSVPGGGTTVRIDLSERKTPIE